MIFHLYIIYITIISIMERKIISLTKKDITKQVTLKGWIDSIRYSKKTTFFELRSGHTPDHIVQCVGKKDKCFYQGIEFCRETYVKILCTIHEVPKKHQTKKGFEIHVDEVLHASPSDPDYSAVIAKDIGTRQKLTQRHLYVRDKDMRLYAGLVDMVMRVLRKTFTKFDCIEIIPALFGSVKCEGGSDIFEMDHMGDTAFLTQSSQMYLEVMVPSVGDCYCIQPSFRKEKSATRRHLSCFSHVEAEFSGYDSFADYLDFLKDFLETFFEYLLIDDSTILDDLDRREFIELWSKKEMVLLEHKEAIKLLKKYGICKKDGTYYEEMDDIKEAEERALIDKIDKIVFLTKFPLMSKAFYSKTDLADPVRAECVDVEFPGVGEIIGSAVRESGYDVLRRKLELFTLRDIADEMMSILKEEKSDYDDIQQAVLTMDIEKIRETLFRFLDTPELFTSVDIRKFKHDITTIPYESYDWYFDLRKYGAGMTAGFGLGLERLITWIAGAHSVKDVTMFPRFMGYLKP